MLTPTAIRIIVETMRNRYERLKECHRTKASESDKVADVQRASYHRGKRDAFVEISSDLDSLLDSIIN